MCLCSRRAAPARLPLVSSNWEVREIASEMRYIPILSRTLKGDLYLLFNCKFKTPFPSS
jgi:hypothetical protein